MLSSVIAQKVGATLLPSVGGFVAGHLFNPKKSDWYKNLKKPDYTLPTWVYTPVWTALYSGIGYSSYIIWRDGGGFEGAQLPLSLYGAQLAINWAWMPMVFGFESLKLGLVNLSIEIPMIAACIYEFFKISHTAGSLMIPYFMWTGFATYLNYAMYKLNEAAKK